MVIKLNYMNLKYANKTATGEKEKRAPFDKEIVDTIIKTVSEFTGVSVELIMAKDRTVGARKRPTVEARHISMYFALDIYRMGVTVLAQYIGERDHTSAMHAEDTVKALIDSDVSFKRRIEKMRKLIFAERNKLADPESTHEWEKELPSMEKNFEDFKAIQNEQ